jgi:hypothetical protein
MAARRKPRNSPGFTLFRTWATVAAAPGPISSTCSRLWWRGSNKALHRTASSAPPAAISAVGQEPPPALRKIEGISPRGQTRPVLRYGRGRLPVQWLGGMTDASARVHHGALGSAAAWPLAARAQQPAVPVIGFLSGQSADDDYNGTVPFLQGADEIGCKRPQPVGLVLRPAIFDRYVLALDIAGFLQAVCGDRLLGYRGRCLVSYRHFDTEGGWS